jgi:ribose transport system ATP-binding protein
MSVKNNIVLPSYRNINLSGIIRNKIERDISSQYIKNLDIKTPSLNSLCMYLSGGNQQKTVLAKWLATNSLILLCDEPTVGIDVKTKEEIYEILRETARQGKTVVLSSIDPDEILTMCDRCYIMYKGAMVDCLVGKDLNKEKLLLLASRGKL